MNTPVLTIDGPSGTGKGTVGKLVAEKLGWHYLDSGAIYRVYGVTASRAGIAVDDPEALRTFGLSLDIEFADENGVERIICNGEELSAELRTEAAGDAASRYAALPAVRDSVLLLQRAQAKPPGLVADGRDMGTTVFPQAEIKIWLDASAEERLQRRYKQLKEKGFSGSLAALREDMRLRDERDASRQASPMEAAEDAVRLDSTRLSIDQVVEKILCIVAEKLSISV